MPIGGLACGTGGELRWTSVSRWHQRIRPPLVLQRTCDNWGLIRPRDFVLSHSRRRATRCWPSAGLRGGQLAVSSYVPWIVGGRLRLRGFRGPGPVRASVVLSRVLVEAGGHTCRAPPRACSSRNTTLQSVSARGGT